MNTVILSKVGISASVLICVLLGYINAENIQGVIVSLGTMIGAVCGGIALIRSSKVKTEIKNLASALKIEELTREKLERRVLDLEKDLEEERKLVQLLKVELEKVTEENKILKEEYSLLLTRFNQYSDVLNRKERELEALKKKLEEK